MPMFSQLSRAEMCYLIPIDSKLLKGRGNALITYELIDLLLFQEHLSTGSVIEMIPQQQLLHLTQAIPHLPPCIKAGQECAEH